MTRQAVVLFSSLVVLLVAATRDADAAAVLCVRPGGGGGCQASIGAALALAEPGDTVRVATATYIENVEIRESVILEGGWNAGFTARDPAAFETVITPLDATFSVVSIFGSFADPASVTPVVDGFTITGGRGDLGGSHGGGLRSHDSDAVIRGNRVVANRAFLFGGGIWVQRGAPRIEANVVADNVAEGDVSAGGGIQLENTAATLVDNVVTGNSIDGAGGFGGGIGIFDSQTLVRVTGGRIQGNRAGTACDGVGGGVHAGFFAPGITRVVLDRVHVEDNCAHGGGGGVHVSGASWTLTNALLVGNDGDGDGEELRASDAAAAGSVRNATLVGTGSGTGVSATTLTLLNSIVTGYATGVAATSVDAAGNDFFGNAADTSGFALDPATNLFVDPLLDAAHRLEPGSPLIDAGVVHAGPFRDIDGEPRPAIGPSQLFRLDVGADERPGIAQRVLDVDLEPADLTILGPGNPPENPDSIGPNDWIGYAVLADDVTGDDLADLTIAAQDWAEDFDTLNASGRILGLEHPGAPRETGVLDLQVSSEDTMLVSERQNQHMGEQLLAADVNGDGVPDLVFGSTQNDGDPTVTSRVFAVFGPVSGTRTIADASPADFELLFPDADYLAFAARNALEAADVGGTAAADIAVGDGLADDGGLADAGAIFVAFGGAGLGGTLDLATAPADFTLYGPAAGAGLQSLALGDLTGDGQQDLVARTATAAYLIEGPLPPGAHRLSTQPADSRVTGLQGNNGADWVAIVDVVGDTQPDLLLTSGADLLVIPGPVATGQDLDAAAAASLRLPGAAPWSFASADLVGDARPDLIVGAQERRRVFVLAGGLGALGSLPIEEVASLVVRSDQLNRLGWSVDGGDLDGDGRDDLVVGTWQENVAGHGPAPEFEDAGVVLVSYGLPGSGVCALVPGGPGPDADGDGLVDACDLCPAFASSNADTDGNGIGDECECGDQSGDGRVNVIDILAINAAIFELQPVSPLCDTNQDGRCNVADILGVNAKIFGAPAYCARYPRP